MYAKTICALYVTVCVRMKLRTIYTCFFLLVFPEEALCNLIYQLACYSYKKNVFNNLKLFCKK